MSEQREVLNSWIVPSDTSRGFYVVRVYRGGATECTCPAWHYRRVSCKHIKRREVGIRAALNTKPRTGVMSDEEKIDLLRDALKALLVCAGWNMDDLEPETVRTLKYVRLVLNTTGE